MKQNLLLAHVQRKGKSLPYMVHQPACEVLTKDMILTF